MGKQLYIIKGKREAVENAYINKVGQNNQFSQTEEEKKTQIAKDQNRTCLYKMYSDQTEDYAKAFFDKHVTRLNRDYLQGSVTGQFIQSYLPYLHALENGMYIRGMFDPEFFVGYEALSKNRADAFCIINYTTQYFSENGKQDPREYTTITHITNTDDVSDENSVMTLITDDPALILESNSDMTVEPLEKTEISQTMNQLVADQGPFFETVSPLFNEYGEFNKDYYVQLSTDQKLIKDHIEFKKYNLVYWANKLKSIDEKIDSKHTEALDGILKKLEKSSNNLDDIQKSLGSIEKNINVAYQQQLLSKCKLLQKSGFLNDQTDLPLLKKRLEQKYENLFSSYYLESIGENLYQLDLLDQKNTFEHIKEKIDSLRSSKDNDWIDEHLHDIDQELQQERPNVELIKEKLAPLKELKEKEEKKRLKLVDSSLATGVFTVAGAGVAVVGAPVVGAIAIAGGIGAAGYSTYRFFANSGRKTRAEMREKTNSNHSSRGSHSEESEASDDFFRHDSSESSESTATTIVNVSSETLNSLDDTTRNVEADTNSENDNLAGHSAAANT